MPRRKKPRRITSVDYPVIQSRFLPEVPDNPKCYDCKTVISELQADVSYVRFNRYLCEGHFFARKRKGKRAKLWQN